MTKRSYNSLKKKVSKARTGQQLAKLKDDTAAKYQREMLNEQEYQDILMIISRKAHTMLNNLSEGGYEDSDSDYHPSDGAMSMSGSDDSYSE